MTAQSGFIGLPINASLRQIRDVVNRMNAGGLNIGGTVTLAASGTTTTVTDARVSGSSKIFLQARSETAAIGVGLGTTYVSATAKGSFTITHADTGETDRLFDWCSFG